jgi:hypothetical protein
MQACPGGDFSTASTQSQVNALPSSSAILRVRALREGDVSVLRRFRQVVELDLFTGWKQEPFRWTETSFTEYAGFAPPSLRQVSLGEAVIPDGALRALGRIHSVNTVIIRNCEGFTEDGLGAVLALPALEHLDVAGCRQVGDEWVPLFVRGVSIRRLLVGGTAVTEHGLQRLREQLPRTAIDTTVQP